MLRFALLPLAAAQDESSLLQLAKASSGSQTDAETFGVEELLATAQELVERESKNRADPIRQCQGGWLDGDGTGGSEKSLGKMRQDQCVERARDRCSDANGATYDTASGVCFCEVGQSGLDGSASGRENCLFFKDGTTDEDMGTAVDGLANLVDSMISSMDQEQAAAARILAESSSNVKEAHGHVSHHTARTVEALETARDDAQEKHEKCVADLATWTDKKNKLCQTWKNTADSLDGCKDACPCDTNPDKFYDAAKVWQNILGSGGWEEIDKLKSDCDDATDKVDDFNCPPLKDAYDLAEAAYQAARSTHLEFCDAYAGALASHQTTHTQITESLSQRQGEYNILQQVKCYIGKIRKTTEESVALAASCPASDFKGLGERKFTLNIPKIADAPKCLPERTLVMKATTTALNYNNPLWENTETLNSLSPTDEVVDAKYGTFMTSHFNKIILCAGGPDTGCISHPLKKQYESAHELFTAGFVRDTSIDQSKWLSEFDAGTHYNVKCPMQRPGFNTVCRDGNRARFGWCNNIGPQSCQSSDRSDADGAIGIGLVGQAGGHTGAGHTCWFAADHNRGTHCTGKTIPTWIYVDLVRSSAQPPVLIMKAVSNKLNYNHPLWENVETLNPTSPVEQVVDAKYAAFMSARFNSLKMCVGGPNTRCISHKLAKTYDSAHELFTAGFVRDTTIDQGTWLSKFDAGSHYNVRCPMQRPGFNTVCRDGNRARFGWCNNIGPQSCQSNDNNDADGAIGIGLIGQAGGHTGAGHTCWFAADHNRGTHCTGKTIPTWIYVEEV